VTDRNPNKPTDRRAPGMHDEAAEMDRDRVRDLLERYGSDPTRFPADERAAARRLLEDSREPEAVDDLSRARREAQDLDALLGLSRAQPPSAELSRRVAEIPLRHPRVQDEWSLAALLSPVGGLWRALAAGLVATALGFGSGMWTRPGDTELSSAAAEEDDGAETTWDEFAMLAFADDLALSELDETDLDDGAPNMGDAP